MGDDKDLDDALRKFNDKVAEQDGDGGAWALLIVFAVVLCLCIGYLLVT